MTPRSEGFKLTLVALLFVACVAAGFWKLTVVANKANDAAARSRAVAAESQGQIEQNARTIRGLCDRGYVIVDVLDASLTAFRQGPKVTNPIAVEFFRRLTADRAALSNSLTDPDSPCNG